MKSSFFLKYQKPVNFLAGFIGLKNCRQKTRPDPTFHSRQKTRPDNHLASSSDRRYRLAAKLDEPKRGTHNETILRN